MKAVICIIIGISVLTGVLIHNFREQGFLIVMAVLWGGGGLLYVLRCLFEIELLKLQRQRRSPNAWVSHMMRKSRCLELMIICERLACLLMYLGCVAIIEAAILLK